MIETIKNAWKIDDLRKKMMFTLFIIVLFRFGAKIPVPFLDASVLQTYMQINSGTIFSYLDMLSGGAFSQATVFAMSISPYINASIIIQLLTVAIPALEQLAKEGEEGRKILNKYTRYCTVALGLLQSVAYYFLMRNYGALTYTEGPAMYFSAVVIITSFLAGSMLVMWMGEQIDNKGIGNGISILLFAGIISRLPSAVFYMYEGAKNWAAGKESGGTDVVLHPAMIPVFLIGMILMLVFIVYISLSERKIPVQYAKRVVGRKMYGGQATTIPIKVNMSGVMPIIFAQTIASIPATIAAFVPSMSDSTFIRLFDTTSVIYCVVYALLIVGFSYFYATIQFNPVEVSNNLKKQGGFIPGYRAGRPTAEFLSKILNRITLFGAIYLAIVAILPIVTGAIFQISALAIGGTSVLIVVSVALDTQKSLEANMMMKQYKGFLN